MSVLTPDLRLLRNAFDEWKLADPETKRDFRNARIALVKKYHGCFYPIDSQQSHGSKILHTSGTSSGSVRSYAWGPCFRAHYQFFEWLKFGGIQYEDVVYLRLAWEKIEAPITRRISKKLTIVTASAWNSVSQSHDIWKLATNNGKRKVILQLCPSYSTFLMREGFPFDVFDPSMVAIYSTGEASSADVERHLRDLGFDYRDAMRCWNGGATFVTCQYGNRHWIDFLSSVKTMASGELICDDLWNLAQYFIGYDNGDKVSTNETGRCQCGLVSSRIEFRDKESLIELDGSPFTYSDLVWVFRHLVSVSIGKEPTLYSVCFGKHVASNTIVIFYDMLERVDPDATAITEKFRSMLCISGRVVLKRSCLFGRFKPLRYTVIEDRIMDSLEVS